jgi:LacI family transcriptional regulator
MKKTSLSDIAKAAGVSKTLVSFVLNGKAKEKGVNKETAERVLQKIKEFNYQPNSVARSLRTGQSSTIGIVVADISNAFYARICRNIEQFVMQEGYNVVLGNSNEDPSREKELLKMMYDRGMDGIILAPTRPYSEIIEKELNDMEIPLVLVDRHYPKSNFHHVIVDNFEIAYKATKHLIDLGHKYIGYIAIKPSHTSVMQERYAGFCQAKVDAGIEASPEYYNELSLEDLNGDIYDKLDCLHYKEGKVTAMVSSNNKVTLSLLECFKVNDIKIPDDISLLSFDYLDVFKLLCPPISSIQLFAEDIGNRAAHLLMEKIHHKDELKNVVLKAKFHPRESIKKI